MAQKKRSLEDRLQAAQLTAANAMNMAKVKEALARYGYDEERLKTGMALYKTAQALYLEQKKKYSRQQETTLAFNRARTKAYQAYIVFLKVARVALRFDRAAREKMELIGPRQKEFSRWLTQAKQFYAGALETQEILEQLELFNIGKENLLEGQALLLEAEAANSRQEMAKADARKATRDRNRAFKEMERWRSDLIAMARLALGPNSQLLESLGVTVPS